MAVTLENFERYCQKNALQKTLSSATSWKMHSMYNMLGDRKAATGNR